MPVCVSMCKCPHINVCVHECSLSDKIQMLKDVCFTILIHGFNVFPRGLFW